jgi:Uma2 family endonuclease
MATTAGISIEQYLKTSYTPDCEYIEGELKEKPLVGFPHGNMQVILGSWFQTHAREWRIKVAVETRTRVTGNKVRLPDLVIVPLDVSAPQGALESAPLIAIEVLSPDDRFQDLQQRAQDLQSMGTENIWLIDPSDRTIRVWDGLTWQPFQGDKLQAAGTEAYLDPAWLWSEFD